MRAGPNTGNRAGGCGVLGGPVSLFFYSAALGLGLAAASPWWLYRMATTARYREGLAERLGRVPARLRGAVHGRRVVWIHAVSVGEVLAVSRLAGDLQAALQARQRALANDPDAAAEAPWTVVVSTTTRTGQALARERFGRDRVFYLPLDFAWTVRAYLRALRPALLILAESELWPRLLGECARGGIPVAVVNARVSDRSFRRAWRVRRVWSRVLGKATLFLAQSEADAERLRALGVGDGAVEVSGNLKYDLRPPKTSTLAELLRGALGDRPVIVAGSVVAGEEEVLARVFREVWATVPTAFLVLAPRHPEHFDAALTALEDFGAVRASSLSAENAANLLEQRVTLDAGGRTRTSRTLAVVLDTIGDLAAVYGVATVAFVGGSLVSRGGHNPLEPARFGVPVVMGPSFENFRDVVAKMQAADSLRIVKNEEELGRTLIELLTNFEAAHSLGERGQTVFKSEGGATARSIQFLMPLIFPSDRDRGLIDAVPLPAGVSA